MFSRINFKYSDALEEKIYAPELIESAYVDVDNVLSDILLPEKFLVVGPKGSGKSALSSKLQMIAAHEWNKFVNVDELEQFEFNLLGKTGGARGAAIGGAASVWQLLLFIKLSALLQTDGGFASQNPKIVSFFNKMKEVGLSPSDSLVALVQKTARRGAFLSFKTLFLEARGDIGADAASKTKDPAALLDAIKDVRSSINATDSSYFLIIDGLDHPIKAGRNNAAYLGDLINSARAVNNYFAERKVDAKVTILIRDEVLAVVPDPNMAKRINDNGKVLKWFDNSSGSNLTFESRMGFPRRAGRASLAHAHRHLAHPFAA